MKLAQNLFQHLQTYIPLLVRRGGREADGMVARAEIFFSCVRPPRLRRQGGLRRKFIDAASHPSSRGGEFGFFKMAPDLDSLPHKEGNAESVEALTALVYHR